MRIITLAAELLTKKIVGELNALLKELRGADFDTLSHARWREIIAQKNVRFFMIDEGEKIIGIAMLRWHELTGGRAGTVEDVVVMRERRGKGLGECLMKKLVQWAERHNFAYLDLTSKPAKAAANHLYQKMGFKKRDTNVYRMVLSHDEE